MPVGACAVRNDDGLDDGGGRTVADSGTGVAGAWLAAAHVPPVYPSPTRG